MAETGRGRRSGSLWRAVGSRIRSASSLRAIRRQRWEQKWEATRTFPWQVGEVAPELDAAVASGWIPRGASVLDIGCGDGVNAAWLAQRGFTVHGVDFAAAAIERAGDRFGDVPGVTFAVADVSVRNALGDRTFDVLVDRGCLPNLPARLRPGYAANVSAWAKPAAPFLLSMLGPPELRGAVERLLAGAFDCESVSTAPNMATANGIARDGLVFRMRRRR